MVECTDCIHFRELPGDTVWRRRTGCYHPVHMVQKQSEGFLKAQEVPGDHERINRFKDCATFEPRARKPVLRRVAELLRS